MQDPYVYPGTNVLINLAGVTDYAEWKRLERLYISVRELELVWDETPQVFDLLYLQSIHRHLTQDLYTWAGELRVSDTGPGGTSMAHCRPEFIVPQANVIFGQLAQKNNLCRRERADFSDGLAWVWGETTALHPFRDVNTRSQFVFFNQLARQAGWAIKWKDVDANLFAHARTIAISGKEEGLEAVIYLALESGQGEKVLGSGFLSERTERSRDVLDSKLSETIKYRQSFQ